MMSIELHLPTTNNRIDLLGFRKSLLPGILAGLFATLMLRLEAASFCVAIPTMIRSLGNDSSLAVGLAMAYLLPTVTTVIIWGRLADYWHTRTLLVAGCCLFAGGAVGAAWQANYYAILFFRAVEGLGNAMLLSAGLVATVKGVETHRTAQVQGWGNTMSCLGSVLGVLLSGWLCEAASWRIVLLLPVPVVPVILALVLLWKPAASSRVASRSAPQPDLIGSILLFLWLGCLTFGFNQGGEMRWTSLPTLGLFTMAAVFAVLWLRFESRAAHPLFDVMLLQRDQSLWHFAVLAALPCMLISGMMFALPLYLQRFQGCTPIQVGWLLTLYSLTRMFASPLSGWLADRREPRQLIHAGLGFFLAAFLTFLGWLNQPGLLVSMVFLLLMAIGTSLTLPNAVAGMMKRTPSHREGMMAGFCQTVNMGSSMMGMCLFETIYSATDDPPLGWRSVCLFGVGVCLVVWYTVFGRHHRIETEFVGQEQACARELGKGALGR